MKSKLIGIIFLLCPVFANALPASDTNGLWIPTVGSTPSTATVKYIEVQPNGRIYVVLDLPDTSWPTAELSTFQCNSINKGWLELDKNASNFKEQFAILTTAYITKSPVQIYADGCGWYPYAQNTVLR